MARTSEDVEVRALKGCIRQLEGLDDAGKERVITFLAMRYRRVMRVELPQTMRQGEYTRAEEGSAPIGSQIWPPKDSG